MCVCVYVCVRVYDMIHLLLYQLRPCYDIVLLCCTVNSYILYVCMYVHVWQSTYAYMCT